MNPLKIIHFIRENKLTKEQFCKMCNISLTTLDNIVYYNNSVDYPTAVRISETMGMGVYELYAF